MSETKFGSWVVPEGRAAVEYSLVVIEEIRQAVSEGFQRFARGGIEVGGVLYGTYDGKTADGKTVRILAVREIVCEHAHGPSFVLSDKDRAALTEQLERDRADPRLEGFTALGWFVSHTRSEIVLSPADQETFEAFFPEMWQVTLVVRPGRIGAMNAGFFVREADGTVKTERSYQNFDFPDRIAMPADRPPREHSSSVGPRGPSQQDAGSATQPESGMAAGERDVPLFGSQILGLRRPGTQAPSSTAAGYAPYPYGKKRRTWVMTAATLLAAAIVAAVAIVAGLRFFAARPVAEPIALAVYEHDTQLRVEWHRDAAPIRSASSGTLEIVDGPNTRNVPLTPADLARGSFTYARSSGDVNVRLEVQNADGDKTQEASRFLGTPPRAADANELDTTQLERDALKDEVTRLRNQNAAEAERIQQLERTLTILRSRLGILEPAKQ